MLETALGSIMSLVHGGAITLPLAIDKLTAAPARFLGMDLGTLKTGSPADVTIFDPDAEWLVDPDVFASKGKNTPLTGTTLRGRVMATIGRRRSWSTRRGGELSFRLTTHTESDMGPPQDSAASA